MIIRIVVPQAFENMEEATVGLWHKSEGDFVARGDGLCDLITEKTTFTLEAEGEGVLRQIAAPAKSVVPVGYVLAVLGDESETLPDIETENRALLEKSAATPATESAPQLNVSSLTVPSLQVPNNVSTQSTAPNAGTRVRATPAARRIARELGVDIEEVAKALPGKVLNEEDVRSYKR